MIFLFFILPLKYCSEEKFCFKGSFSFNSPCFPNEKCTFPSSFKVYVDLTSFGFREMKVNSVQGRVQVTKALCRLDLSNLVTLSASTSKAACRIWKRLKFGASGVMQVMKQNCGNIVEAGWVWIWGSTFCSSAFLSRYVIGH